MPALHPKCANRDHEWDRYPPRAGKSRCKRAGCGKIYGARKRRGPAAVPAKASPALAGKPAPLPPPLTPAVPPAPAQGGRSFAALASRLATRQGIQAAPMPADDTPPSPSPEPPEGDGGDIASAEGEGDDEPKRFSLTEWLIPELPEMAVAGAGWTVRKLGREPGEPDTEWRDRWQEAFDEGVSNRLPKMEMPWWLALLVATLMLVISMYLAGEKLPPKAAPKPIEPKPEAPCPTDAQAAAPSHVASPASAGASDESAILTSLQPLSGQPLTTSSSDPSGTATLADAV